MSEQVEDDLEKMDGAFGLYVGQLTPDELAAFNRLCVAGYACRSYRGTAAAIFGLATALRDFPATDEEHAA